MNKCSRVWNGGPQIVRNQRHQQTGFTLIELMVVIAIISILATIALAAYSNFMMRSKVAEGLAFASEAKTAVTSFYAGNNRFPLDNTEAGLPAGATYDKFNFISSLEVNQSATNPSDGIITVSLKIPGIGSNNKLELVPTSQEGRLTWECRPAPTNGIDTVRVPPNCRS